MKPNSRPPHDSAVAVRDRDPAPLARVTEGHTPLRYHRSFYGTLKPIMRGGRRVGMLHFTREEPASEHYRPELMASRLMRKSRPKVTGEIFMICMTFLHWGAATFPP